MQENRDYTQDDFRNGPGDYRSRQIQNRACFLETVFFMDEWLFIILNFNFHLVVGMPPERIYDWDFNQHYETDRKWVTRYAGDIKYARDTLIELTCRLGMEDDFTGSLDFDPFENLRGKSPLNEYRDIILGFYDSLLYNLEQEKAGVIRKVFNDYVSQYLHENEESKRIKIILQNDINRAALRSFSRSIDLKVSFNNICSLKNVPGFDDQIRYCIDIDALISSVKPLLDLNSNTIQILGPIRGAIVRDILSAENYREEKAGFFERLLFGRKEQKPAVPDLRDIFLDLYCDLVLSGKELYDNIQICR